MTVKVLVVQPKTSLPIQSIDGDMSMPVEHVDSSRSKSNGLVKKKPMPIGKCSMNNFDTIDDKKKDIKSVKVRISFTYDRLSFY
jgi:hypothetical protein